jgi:hypothetical protein
MVRDPLPARLCHAAALTPGCPHIVQEKIPGFAQSLIILPRTSKYTKLYVQPIQCVVDGKAPVPQKGFFARLFGK